MKAYYLGPDKGGARAYRLLSQALRESGRVAIAKYATRGERYLVMLRPHEEGIVVDQLRYAAEVKPARQLIDQSSVETFEPQKYTDEVREKMLELIQRKVEGQEITVAPTEEPRTQIIDLMAALKASLAGAEERKPASRAGKKSEAEEAPAKKAAPKKKRAAG